MNKVASENEKDSFRVFVVSVNRVAKVVAGGRRFSVSVLVVVGDCNGSVGYGLGKAKEIAEAKIKAEKQARKNMIKVRLKQKRTLHHDTYGHYGAGKVILRSAPAGTGIIAGGSMRSIFDALGIKDIVSKSIQTPNPHNIVKATFNALSKHYSPRSVAERRGLKYGELMERRKTAETE